MRPQVFLAGVMMTVSLSTAPTAGAQQQQPGAQRQPARPGVIVVSQNKCRLDAVARVDSLNAAVFYPILDEMVRDGRLLSWGVLDHLWGDEWNVVIYYTAADLAAFNAAFSEVGRRLTQRQPNFMTGLGQYCTEHKDNIYGVRRLSAPATPPPR